MIPKLTEKKAIPMVTQREKSVLMAHKIKNTLLLTPNRLLLI